MAHERTGVAARSKPLGLERGGDLRTYFRREWMLYLLVLPGIVYFILFKYLPMGGVVIAFKDYRITSTIFDAPWVGLKNFFDLFSRIPFQRVLRNNILISFYKLIWGFPFTIFLSLMINEIRGTHLRKFVQTSVILPNFISWVVIAGLLSALFSPYSGAIKVLSPLFGTGVPPNILTQKETFRAVIIVSHIWQGAGIGTIVYLSAMASIDPALYEAASIDGAGRWRQMWHITLSSIRSTIVVLLMFRVGAIMSAGFDQIFAISNDLVMPVADIIDTYVFRLGLEQRKFGVATAAGLFQSAIGMALVIITNKLANRIDPDSSML